MIKNNSNSKIKVKEQAVMEVVEAINADTTRQKPMTIKVTTTKEETPIKTDNTATPSTNHMEEAKSTKPNTDLIIVYQSKV